MLCADDPYLELACRNKSVVVVMLEVDEAHRWAVLARLAILADARVFKQKLKNVLVVLNQTCAGKTGCELLNDFFDLIFFKPRIDDFQLLSQDREHDHFRKTLSERLRRILFGVAIDYLPAKALKLVEERLFDVITFVEF